MPGLIYNIKQECTSGCRCQRIRFLSTHGSIASNHARRFNWFLFLLFIYSLYFTSFSFLQSTCRRSPAYIFVVSSVAMLLTKKFLIQSAVTTLKGKEAFHKQSPQSPSCSVELENKVALTLWASGLWREVDFVPDFLLFFRRGCMGLWCGAG